MIGSTRSRRKQRKFLGAAEPCTLPGRVWEGAGLAGCAAVWEGVGVPGLRRAPSAPRVARPLGRAPPGVGLGVYFGHSGNCQGKGRRPADGLFPVWALGSACQDGLDRLLFRLVSVAESNAFILPRDHPYLSRLCQTSNSSQEKA